MDCDSFVLSIRNQNNFIDLKKFEHLFDFSILNENNELFSNKNEKVMGKYKIETPKKIWIDEFIASRSNAYFFKRNDKNANEVKGFSNSQSKNIKFDEF